MRRKHTRKKYKKRDTKRKYKKHKKSIRKKRLKYKKITRLGKKWIKQMEIYMKSIEKYII